MERYYFLTERELFDLSSRKKSLRGLKIKHVKVGDKQVYFTDETMEKFKLDRFLI